MSVFISGSRGLIGSALSDYLKREGYEIISMGRSFQESPPFKSEDIVIHLAGESIANGRWTTEKKERIRNSRVRGTTALAQCIAQSNIKPAAFISASAIGFYGDRGDQLLTEASSKGSGFLSDVCSEWEHATIEAVKADVRVVNLRTGIVLSERGGALQKMLFPFKMGLGGIIGNGHQFMSWISLADVVRSIEFIIKNGMIRGVVNLSAPHPVRNREFTKTLGSFLKRPTIIPLPARGAKIVFGEMAEALLLSSARVLPAALMETEFPFKHEHLSDALEDILK